MKGRTFRKLFILFAALAIAYLTTAIFGATQSFYIRYVTGERYFKEGNYLGALREFEIADIIKPEDDRASGYLLWTYDRLGMNKQAGALLERLIAKHPADQKLLTRFADVCYSLHNFARAEVLYKRVYGMTKDRDTRRKLAEVLTWQKKYDEAMPLLKEMYLQDPKNKELALTYAQALGYGRYFDEAIPIFTAMEKRYPGDMRIKYLFAAVLESNASLRAARKRYLEILAADPKNIEIKTKVARLSAWIKDYPSAKKYYSELLAERPGDPGLTAEFADVLFWSGDYTGALELYQKIKLNYAGDKERLKNLGYCYLALKRYDDAATIFRKLQEMYPSDTSIQMALADTLLSSERKYEEAITVLKKIVAAEPDNLDALWWLARLLSWNRRQKEALPIYDELISKDPLRILPRREKARALGWMRRYKDSIDEYRRIQTEVARDEASRLEMEAKEALYKHFDSRAIEAYKKWLEKEPEDDEALFDLAQLYSRNMQWDKAISGYGEILKIFPSHFQAKPALSKAEVLSKAKEAEAGFEYFRKDSSSRDDDEKYYDIYTKLRAPLMKDLYISIREDTFIHEFEDISSVTRERAGAAIEFFKKPLFWAKAGIYGSFYNKGFKDNLNSREELNFRPADWALMSFSHARDDVLDNSETLRRNLREDDYNFRLQLDPNRRISLGGDYVFSDYTDGNRKNTFGFDAKTQLFYEPRSLTLMYRYEQYGYDRGSGYYFSPGSFHYSGVSLEWRHFLNKEELFWGANDTYYTVRYTANFEVNDNIGHTFFADFRRDWTDRFSTCVEWSKTFYNHSKVYRSDRALAYATYRF